MAVSVVSPFIKFKNASKETIDASDELVEELRRALIQSGQRLSRHIRKESREADLEQKLQYIEQFCPILVDCLCRITKAPANRKKRATEGIIRLLGRDVNTAKKELKEAQKEAKEMHQKGKLHVVDPPAPKNESPALGEVPQRSKKKGETTSGATPKESEKEKVDARSGDSQVI